MKANASFRKWRSFWKVVIKGENKSKFKEGFSYAEEKHIPRRKVEYRFQTKRTGGRQKGVGLVDETKP